MKAMIVSIESFQSGEIPDYVKEYCRKNEPFIILDESSKIKTNTPCRENKKSKRTQAILKLNTVGERCILTGTFMSKSPVNAYDQMNFLCKDFFPESIYEFAEKYTVRRNLASMARKHTRILFDETNWRLIYNRLHSTRNEREFQALITKYAADYGTSIENLIWIYQHKEYTPFKHIDDLWKRIGDTVFRVDRQTYASSMPPKIYKSIQVEMTATQKKLYKSLLNLHLTDDISVKNGLELYLRLQDVCNGFNPVNEGTDENPQIRLDKLSENPKLDVLEEVVESIGNKQVVVWCNRTSLLNACVDLLKSKEYTVGVYNGLVSENDRQQAITDFANKKIQVLVANQASAAYGLDALKEADYAIYLSNSYSVEQRVQSEDRIYRGNITRSKYIVDITIKGTCEDRVTKALRLGKELLTGKYKAQEMFGLC